MDMLNNDCLLQIFSYLKLRDLIALEKESERFQEPVQITYRSFTVFDINKEECDEHDIAAEMFSKVGPYVRILKGIGGGKYHVFTEEMFGMFIENCPNVEHIDLLEIPLEDMDVLKYLNEGEEHSGLRHLKSISLIGCNLSDTDAMLYNWFRNAEQLESVDLSRNQKITGACLTFFNKVKRMSLKRCISLERHHFVNFCRENQNLTCLKIGGCSDINQTWITIMHDQLKNLTELFITCPDFPDSINLTPLADLPQLVKLHLHSCNSAAIPLLKRLSFHNRLKVLEYSLSNTTGARQEILCESVKIRGLKKYTTIFWPAVDDNCLRLSTMELLEELHIPGSEVTDDIYQFIMKCPTLKYVDLKCCMRITDAFAEKIIPELYNNFKQLRINANFTNISKEYKQILCGKNRLL
ncbi:uncharacterized protein DMENIID0001_091700 [Sergentomyia squamirostris]